MNAADIPASPAYLAFTALFEAHASGHHYYQDFTRWDRSALAHNPAQALWVLGTCYTNLMLYRTTCGAEILEYRLRPGENCRFFAWENGQARELTPQEARAFFERLPHLTQFTRLHGLPFLERGGTYRRVTEDEARILEPLEQRPERGEDYWDLRATFAQLTQLDQAWDQAQGAAV